jgi:hypothetical protein
MTARLRVPTYLQASTDVGGPARMEWLAALPDRVEQLTARWGLDLGEPFEPGGNCAWVAPATDPDGRDVVLKVADRLSLRPQLGRVVVGEQPEPCPDSRAGTG